MGSTRCSTSERELINRLWITPLGSGFCFLPALVFSSAVVKLYEFIWRAIQHPAEPFDVIQLDAGLFSVPQFPKSGVADTRIDCQTIGGYASLLQ